MTRLSYGTAIVLLFTAFPQITLCRVTRFLDQQTAWARAPNHMAGLSAVNNSIIPLFSFLIK
jgi:hypothetical protein